VQVGRKKYEGVEIKKTGKKKAVKEVK